MPRKSTTKRADGRYQVKVYIGTNGGKKQYKYAYGKTQKEANLKADEIRASLRKGIDVTATGDAFEVWADLYLASKKAEVSPNRYAFLKSKVAFFKQCFYNRKITQIKPYEVQQIIGRLSAQNPTTGRMSAKQTVRVYIQVIFAIFEYALDNRVIEYNPASKIKAPQNAPQKHRRALTAEERGRVIEFEHRAQPAAMLMMLSGLRRGEATALQWDDIDFKQKTISVTKSFDFGQHIFKSPKNGKSRVVDVPDLLIDYLAALPRKSSFVLTNTNGNIMTKTNWKRLFESYMIDMNLKYGFENPPSKFAPQKAPMNIQPFTPHDLRHTFCTIMYEAGIDVLVAKEQMGHSDVSVTLGIYTHLNSEHKKSDISKLNDFLSKSKNGCQRGVKTSEQT